MLQDWATWLALSGALTAFAVNVWASTKVIQEIRWLFVSIASLSLVYAVAYVVLLADIVTVATWSNFLRPIGLISWLIAWSIEPYLLVRYAQKKAHSIGKLAEEKLDSVLS